jgi:competence protein ComEA
VGYFFKSKGVFQMKKSILVCLTLVSALTLGQCALASGTHSRAHQTKTVVAQTSKVNINTSTVQSLSSVKGIGPKRAQLIVAYRKAHGLFKSTQDLTLVKGIGPGLLKKIGSKLTVS